ncbi:dihydropteroate synthase [Ophiocordyceps camponoti-floridani]|uniref:Dihydropteroate synthase n=1 Tax=Ophiocordyceps camponoti-floridani TaxID=2030778 RepID=A0A8H4QBY4_9HYPO|nr:dihydropteroate synthase [Ophiocordyceps camponoti-floridani]
MCPPPAAPNSYRQVREAADRAPASVRVRGLQTTVQGPRDAWGRPDRSQPMTLSADVSLRAAFAATSSRDALAVDTVHYGKLSKAILASVGSMPSSSLLTLSSVLAHVWRDVTCTVDDDQPSDRDGSGARSLLDAGTVGCLVLTARLPKASLMGDGVSFSLAGGVADASEPVGVLRLHALRVPTVIGINENERMARQSVVMSVEVERLDASTDIYPILEAKIVEETTLSTFGTLEALAVHIMKVVALYLNAEKLLPLDGSGSLVTIILEKPMAVPFADAPAVELRLNTNDVLLGS